MSSWHACAHLLSSQQVVTQMVLQAAAHSMIVALLGGVPDLVVSRETVKKCARVGGRGLRFNRGLDAEYRCIVSAVRKSYPHAS